MLGLLPSPSILLRSRPLLLTVSIPFTEEDVSYAQDGLMLYTPAQTARAGSKAHDEFASKHSKKHPV